MSRTRSKPRGRPPAASVASSTGPAARGLDNALALLDVIAASDGILLTEAAQRAGVAPSTAHRVLTTLEAHGFLRQDTEHEDWRIGVKAFEVGNAFLRDRKVADVGRPIMTELMEATGETVNLSLPMDDTVVFVAQVETHNALRAFERPGNRAPLHASASGKLVLAHMTQKARTATLHRTGLETFTPATRSAVSDLAADLDAAIARGFAIEVGEQADGLTCVAAPIYNEHGDLTSCLSVSGPVTRMDEVRRFEIGPQARRAADAITRAIGGRQPRPAEPASAAPAAAGA
ncbi:MAG: IclR family transcriptional regulator [Pseudomonadota bacterium]